MSGIFEAQAGHGIAGLFGALGRLLDTARNFAGERMEQLGSAWRAEVRRLAMALALGLMSAFFVCAAAALAMFAVLLAFWDTHRVLAAALVGACFAGLALIAVLMLRNCTRSTTNHRN